MIPQLASPSVCVIDDEPADYRPILDALLRLGLGCVHVQGNTLESLPPSPFRGLRIVFTDLHLTAATGKDAASHTANVFTKVVSSKNAPVVVVIWSKYASDAANIPGVPSDDQPTEAEQFKKELLAADPLLNSRLIFIEMPKPKGTDRPENGEWIEALKTQIGDALKEFDAYGALWTWESMISDACLKVSATLTDIASSLLGADHTENGLTKPHDQLRLLLKLLAQQQGGPDCADATAPRHLLTVLSHLGQDEVERLSNEGGLNAHGRWLAEALGIELKNKCKTAKLNSILLTGQASPSFAAFSPGTVFDITDPSACQKDTGLSLDRLVADCCDKKEVPTDFKDSVKPIVLEITPSCDFHQGHRRSAMLIGGIVCPVSLKKKANLKDSCKVTPEFEDRFSSMPSNVVLVFSSRHRFTYNHDALPAWLTPRLRIRDALMADIRNWHASQASRAGYLSF